MRRRQHARVHIEGPSPHRSREFERHRPRLFGIAYRMLSSRADAEDVLQDAYLAGIEEERRSCNRPTRGS